MSANSLSDPIRTDRLATSQTRINMKNHFLRLLFFGLVSQTVLAQTSSNPAGLSAIAQSSTRINLSWKDNSTGELGFEIHRSTDNRTFTKISDAGAGAVSYQDATVLPSTRYYYKVRASLRGGTTTGFSNTADATTPAPLPVVSDLSATARNATTIDLTWTVSGKEPLYYVERRVGTGRFSRIGTGSGSYSDNTASPGIEYCYQVQFGESAEPAGYSNIACATPPVVLPVTPSGLVVSAISDTQLQLFWSDANVQAVTFEISRADKPGGAYQVIQPDYAQKIFDDKSLNAASPYCYRVRARNSAGVYSNYSTEVCGTTRAAPAIVPDPPTNLIATALSPTEIRLSWTATTSTFGTGYLLERATSPAGAYSTTADLAGNQTTFTDTRLSPNTSYCYRVRTKYNATLSGPGNEVCATTQPPAPTVPNPPGRLSATAVAFDRVNLSWADGSGNETGFEIQQSPDGVAWNTIGTAPENATTYQVAGLNGATRYYYRVQAVNGVGPSGYTEPVNVLTPAAPVPPPSAPTGLTATAVSATQINLTWTNTATTATGYEVDQSPDGTGNWTKIGDAPASATTYQNTGLTPNTRYFYRVRAVNQGGGANSNVANAITPDVAPAAPIRLTAQAASYSAVSLSWSDGSANETGFEIQQSTDGTIFNRVGTVGANVTSYQQTGLNGSTTYYYRVLAFNAIGPSGYSNVADATTPPAPLPGIPANLTAVPVDFDLIKLTWSPVSANTTSVVIERSTSSTSGFVEIGQQVPGRTEFGDVGVLPIATYYYRIKAVNSAGSSDYSNVAKVDAEAIIDAVPEPLNHSQSIYVADRTLFVKLGRPADARIQIVNLQGLLVLDRRATLDAGFSYQYPVSDLSAGLYVVAVQTAGSNLTKKILLP